MSIHRDKLSRIIGEPKEVSYICDSDKYWPVGEGFCFLIGSFSMIFRNNMPQVT